LGAKDFVPVTPLDGRPKPRERDAVFFSENSVPVGEALPGPLASVALQKSAPESIAILTSSASSAAIVPGPMPPPVAA
jgi:hypothetical protein